ncbi:MAG: short chain dehydrogenase [Candidatus Altiarchaeales archaeon HGW-Altiarchaeales-2]|nr:MAG: short chain dehydrogenase [Candidatus Altiarchaeales archaeon HGW-Altiarchaeales-2]
MEEILFVICGIIAIAFSVAVIISRDIVHSAVYLAGTFIVMAILYITLKAFFLSAVQILVYVGGVIVLMLFAIMLIKNEENKNLKR